MLSHYDLNDQDFIADFKSGVLPPACFSHEAHLRLAWLQIRELGIEEAIPVLRQLIIRYVDGLGARDKYHDTLTVAAARTVHHFMLQSSATTFPAFIEAFPRLTADFKGLLACHYSPHALQEPLARTTYQEPDLLPFD